MFKRKISAVSNKKSELKNSVSKKKRAQTIKKVASASLQDQPNLKEKSNCVRKDGPTSDSQTNNGSNTEYSHSETTDLDSEGSSCEEYGRFPSAEDETGESIYGRGRLPFSESEDEAGASVMGSESDNSQAAESSGDETEDDAVPLATPQNCQRAKNSITAPTLGSRDGAGVEIYKNLGVDFDPSEVLDKIGEIRTITVPCELPEDQKERRKTAKMKKRAIDTEGFTEKECPVCSVGDDGLTEHSKEVLKQILNMDRSLYLRIDSDKLRSLIVSEYNRNIYETNRKLGRPDVPKWTEYSLKWHEEHCDRRRPEKWVYNDLDFLQKQMDLLRRNAVFERKVVGNSEVDGIFMNYKASLHWIKLAREKLEHLKALFSILDGDGKFLSNKGAKSSNQQNLLQQDKRREKVTTQKTVYFKER